MAITKVGENPNDKMPPGKPLHPDRIVSEDHAGSAAMEQEFREERASEDADASEDDGDGSDFVNAGKFNDPDKSSD